MDEASVIDATPPVEKALSQDRGKLGRWRLPRSLRRFSGPLLVIIIWQLLSTVGLLNPHTLAPPIQVVRTGWDLIQSGTLGVNAWASLKRVLVGAAFGVSSGLVLAVLGGLFRFGEDLVDALRKIAPSERGILRNQLPEPFASWMPIHTQERR